MENLSTFLIPAPLSALLTLISGISFVFVFDFYGRKIFRSDELVLRALYFFGGLLCLGWIIWVVCLAKMASVLLFKILLWTFIAHGSFLILIYRKTQALQLPVRSLAQLHSSGKQEIYFSWLLKGVLVVYGLLCLTIPTDADSLNYHLALPVNILNSGSLWFNQDYLCFRMAGFGEMINIIGVANGCPQLGSFIQMIALLWVLAVFLQTVPQENRITLLTAFLAIPVLLFLLPNQKHQLTGVLCTSLCFFVLSEKKNLITPPISSLLIALLLFAAGLKYSFLISVAVLFLLMAWNCQSRSEIIRLTGKSVLWFLIILGPVLVFRWIHLGDPLSPFLERFKSIPDPIILKPFEIMRNSGSVFPFPLNLLFPSSIGTISTIIGFSCILISLLWQFRKQYLPEILSIAGVFTLTFLTGQIAPRFFLEPVLWSLPLVFSRPFHLRFFTYFTYALRFQFLILLPFILFGLYSLGPSLLTDKLRTEVMMQSAQGYAESIWINEVLPDNARICFASRSRAYLSRTYFPWEYLFLSSLENKEEAEMLDFKLRNQYKIDYIVLPVHGFEAFKKKYAGSIVTVPKKFSYAVRNPFNRTEYEMAIYKMK